MNLRMTDLVSITFAIGLLFASGPLHTSAADGDAREFSGESAAAQERASRKLPRLIEFGSDTCVPCKMMAPILDALRTEYAGRLQIEFVDVKEDPAAGLAYNVQIIPTQIFFDATGEERFRHQGFMSKEDLLKKWHDLGVDLGKPDGATRHAGEEAGTGGVSLGRLFTSLTRAVEATPLIAVGAALLWGILSIVLSPCHLASIPLIIGFIDGQGRVSTRRAFLISTLFALGILITIAGIGVVTAAAGRMLGDVGKWGNVAVAVLFCIVGLVLMDVVPVPWSGPGQVGMKRKGVLAAFVLGLVFGIALGPCTFAYMAPMLGVTFKLATAHAAYGVLLLAAYGVGHCSVIVLAGTCTSAVQRYLNWSEKSKGAVILKRVCGVLVLLGGVYLICTV